MKLLILLIALLACTNFSSSRPAPQKHYREILKQLLEMNIELNKKSTQNDTTVFTPFINISTPNAINTCECGAQFKKHLNESIHRVFHHLEYKFFDEMGIIIDTLEEFHPTPNAKDGSNTSCNFQNHTIHNLTEINSIMIKDNINFIQESNAKCRSHKN